MLLLFILIMNISPYTKINLDNIFDMLINIKTLYKSKFEIFKIKDYDNSETCPICYENYDLTNINNNVYPCYYNRCNHSMCIKCITKMKNKHYNKCPICRTNFDYIIDNTLNLDSRSINVLLQDIRYINNFNDNLLIDSDVRMITHFVDLNTMKFKHICKHYLNGFCCKNNHCQFMHPFYLNDIQRPLQASDICIYSIYNICSFGHKCGNYHVKRSDYDWITPLIDECVLLEKNKIIINNILRINNNRRIYTNRRLYSSYHNQSNNEPLPHTMPLTPRAIPNYYDRPSSSILNYYDRPSSSILSRSNSNQSSIRSRNFFHRRNINTNNINSITPVTPVTTLTTITAAPYINTMPEYMSELIYGIRNDIEYDRETELEQHSRSGQNTNQDIDSQYLDYQQLRQRLD